MYLHFESETLWIQTYLAWTKLSSDWNQWNKQQCLFIQEQQETQCCVSAVRRENPRFKKCHDHAQTQMKIYDTCFETANSRVLRTAWLFIPFLVTNLCRSHAKEFIRLIVSNRIIEDERISIYSSRLIVMSMHHRQCLLAIRSTYRKKHKLESMSQDPEAHAMFSVGKNSWLCSFIKQHQNLNKLD